MSNDNVAAFAKQITEIGYRYFMPPKDSEAAKDPTYVRYCQDACDTLVAVATTFSALKTFHPTLVTSAFADLTMGMSLNTFWKQHGTYLTPVFNTALNALFDSYQLRADKANNPNHTLWDNMEYATRTEWFSIASAIAFCFGGYRKMREVSLALRKELEAVA